MCMEFLIPSFISLLAVFQVNRSCSQAMYHIMPIIGTLTYINNHLSMFMMLVLTGMTLI